jgi:hypothetical protein
MTHSRPIASGCYSHDLLIHDNDQQLVDGSVAFVEQGLSSGGQVLVHSCAERVAMLRSVLGTHPRLQYGLDDDLYLSPMTTLFDYARVVARSQGTGELWVTGTVPFGPDRAVHPSWTRYESLVNEVLGRYAFHALCTYDTRTLPAATVEAARATHPCTSNGTDRAASADYVDPAAFLTDPRAASPCVPTSPPAAGMTLHDTEDLRSARHLIARLATAATAVSRDTLDSFIGAVNEALVNGLQHGRPPVEVTIWVDLATVTCVVVDAGSGIDNPLSGYRRPDDQGFTGLWLARQSCENLIIRNPESGGCSVLVTTA